MIDNAASLPTEPQPTALLMRLAKTYVWWQSAEQTIRTPEKIIVQVMTIGDYDDVQALVHAIGVEPFRQALHDARIGQFDGPSWHYWHHRLGMLDRGEVPLLPSDRFRS